MTPHRALGMDQNGYPNADASPLRPVPYEAMIRRQS
jgi:hypothetical protein